MERYGKSMYNRLTEAEEVTWEQKKAVYDKKKDELLSGMNFEPLFDKINEVIGSKVEFHVEGKEGRDGKYFSIKSNDILDLCGVFALILERCTLETFSSSCAIRNKDDLDNCHAYYWGSIDFDYQHKGGGHNSMELLRFDYNYDNDGKWNFKVVGE